MFMKFLIIKVLIAVFLSIAVYKSQATQNGLKDDEKNY